MSSAPGEPGEWADEEVPKRLLEGTHRAAAIEETLERARLAMPAVNITRVATITGLDVTGIPSVAVYRPGARGAPVAAGKGLSLVAAKVSGLMEAIASYHAEHITSPLRLASLDELSRTCRVIRADGLPRPDRAPAGAHRCGSAEAGAVRDRPGHRWVRAERRSAALCRGGEPRLRGDARRGANAQPVRCADLVRGDDPR